MCSKINSFFFLFCFLIYPNLAHSYVGPGLGLGSLIVILGLIGSIVLAFLSLIYLPIKKLLKKKKNKDQHDKENRN